MDFEKYFELDRKSFIIKAAERYSKEVKRVDEGEKFLQLFDYDAVINEDHLIAAYMNAVNAFDEKSNIAKSIGMETMLFAAMTKQIGEAINMLGAKEGRPFVVFSNSAELYRRTAQMLIDIKDFEPNEKAQKSVALKYGIKGDMKIGMLEKMACSRL